MLERCEQSGLTIYLSPLFREIGVPHAFSTRTGGVSQGPFESLNLGTVGGSKVQDPVENLRENYRRLHAATGCSDREHCGVFQVHGSNVRIARRGEPFENGVQADALVSDDPSRTIGIKYADCVPILLASKDGSAVAAVHAGWRGLLAGVLSAAITQLKKLAPNSPTIAAIGPCVGTDAFEVGPEVVRAFADYFGADAPIHRHYGEKAHIDLRQATVLQLRAAGIEDKQIDLTDLCTFTHRADFFSHRRDGMLTGRMAAVIGCKARA